MLYVNYKHWFDIILMNACHVLAYMYAILINHDICHETFKCHAIMLKWFNKSILICYMKHACVPYALILF
jgi:hypothetical protein